MLPSPRVELRWSNTRNGNQQLICEHNLVLDLKAGDVRREQLVEGSDEFEDVPILTIGIDVSSKEVGEEQLTAVTEGDADHGSILLPYRLTSQALWDARQLGGIPVYVVSGNRALRVDTCDVAGDISQDRVFVLQSDTEVGIQVELFTTRQDAEDHLRVALGKCTTYTVEGPQSMFNQTEIEALIGQSRRCAVNVRDSDAYWIQEQVVQGKSTRRVDVSKSEKEKRLPLVVAIQVFGRRKVNDSEVELVPVQEIRLDAQEKSWVRQWTWLVRQHSRANQTEVSEMISIDLGSVANNAPLELGRAFAKAGAAGFNCVYVNLCVIPDPVASSTERIRSLMAQDVFGDYDVPSHVADWAWIEENASFVHTSKIRDGVWDFILNMARSLDGAPQRLASIIEETREAGISWLMVHQGT